MKAFVCVAIEMANYHVSLKWFRTIVALDQLQIEIWALAWYNLRLGLVEFPISCFSIIEKTCRFSSCFKFMTIVVLCYSALPMTKEQLKEKNRKLRKELGTVRSQYEENVWSVIKNLEQCYDKRKNNLMSKHETLKRLIESSTTDEILERCRVPEHKHSIQNKRIYCCKCNCSISEKLRFIVFSC